MDEGPIKIISLPHILIQLCERKLGHYCSSYLGNDIYYLNEVVTALISYLGRDWLKKEYPKYDDKLEKKLDMLTNVLRKVKVYYDPLEDKKFNSKNTERDIKRQFLKASSRIALIEKDLYDLFIFLLRRTSLQRRIIPSEAFKILEHTGFRKIELDPKRKNLNMQESKDS